MLLQAAHRCQLLLRKESRETFTQPVHRDETLERSKYWSLRRLYCFARSGLSWKPRTRIECRVEVGNEDATVAPPSAVGVTCGPVVRRSSPLHEPLPASSNATKHQGEILRDEIRRERERLCVIVGLRRGQQQLLCAFGTVQDRACRLLQLLSSSLFLSVSLSLSLSNASLSSLLCLTFLCHSSLSHYYCRMQIMMTMITILVAMLELSGALQQ
nr:PREDICTED: uncharacterized protein LOC103983993 [Musa acuminata subsp. malaccensis]